VKAELADVRVRIKGKAGASYTFRDFISNISLSDVVQRLDGGEGASRRGLPRRYHLSDPETANVLLDGPISLPKGRMVVGVLRKCLRSGWLYPESSESDDPCMKYDFPSKWHSRVVECLLYGAGEASIAESSIRARIKDGIIDDYIILDFRKSIPRPRGELPSTLDSDVNMSFPWMSGALLKSRDCNLATGKIYLCIPSLQTFCEKKLGWAS
jgi:hypothetical protein